MVKFLLDNGADINVPTENNILLLMELIGNFICRHQEKEEVRYLRKEEVVNYCRCMEV